MSPGRSPATQTTREDDARVEPAAAARQRSLRKDYLLDLRRAIFLGTVGAVVWPCFVLYDALQTRVLESGNLGRLVGLRVLGELLILGALVVLRRTPPIDEATFRRLVASVVFGFSALLALLCVFTDGLTSIYVAGNMLAGVALVFAPQPFWSAMRTIFVSLSAHPLVLGAAALFDPRIARQLDDPHVVGRLLQYALCALILGTAIAGFSQAFHAMREQLHESRGIGRYRLRRLLGAGGSSEVWAAYHVGLEREVALKILEPRLEHEEDARRRFGREVRATASLTHPNTIRLYDHGATEEGLLFYAMEMLEGRTLADLVAEEGRLPAGRALHLVHQAARALAEAHARGIVHRDLKPENLFLCHAGLEPDFVKVLDFGIATVPVELGDADAERGVGTPTTMSPEVIQGRGASAASDVYGMGVVLYFLVTGAYPFGDRGSSAILAGHVRATPIAPSARIGAALPEALDRLVMRCLAKDPAERPADGLALAHLLAALVSEHPWTPGDASPRSSPPAPITASEETTTRRPARLAGERR